MSFLASFHFSINVAVYLQPEYVFILWKKIYEYL